MFQMDLEYNKGVLFARLSGNLNKKASYKLNNYLIPVLLKHKIKYLVYNLFLLDKIDDVGLRALLNTKCAIRKNKGKIYLCEVNDELKRYINKININKTETELTALELLKV